jgi:hypothetical protein
MRHGRARWLELARISMRGRRKSDKSLKPIVVTLDDGSIVRCSLTSIGREQQPRWILMDNAGVQYIGPEATTDKSPEGVQRLVSDWWATRTVASEKPGKSGKSAKLEKPGKPGTSDAGTGRPA